MLLKNGRFFNDKEGVKQEILRNTEKRLNITPESTLILKN
jgi:hypothetical protein